MTKEQRAANSTFAIGGVSYSADSLVVAESFVLRINISDKNPALRKPANRWAQAKTNFNGSWSRADFPMLPVLQVTSVGHRR